MHTLWEGLILQIKGGGLPKGLIIGNIYRPPRMLTEEIKQLINEFTLLILSMEKYKFNINLAGDYNLNLLKIMCFQCVGTLRKPLKGIQLEPGMCVPVFDIL